MKRILFLFLFLLCSCNKENFVQEQNELVLQTYNMKFVGQVDGYDGAVVKSNDLTTKYDEQTNAWEEGDKLYINFIVGNDKIPGEATYYADTKEWIVSAFDKLPIGENQKCEVIYASNAICKETSTLKCSKSLIYIDSESVYSVSKDNSLVLNAILKPITPRIRFKGTPGDIIKMYGLCDYKTYDFLTYKYELNTPSFYELEVEEDGYTSYCYGCIPLESRKLSVIGKDFAYTLFCGDDVLADGESGYIDIPSEESHDGWINGVLLTVSGVDFTMLPVVGYGEQLYLIAETEVTEALYKSVNGTSSTSKYPITSVSYSDVYSWLNTLSQMTHLQFSLPTADQWKYAAKGGSKSQNYTYAGSNNADEVAWYAGNSSSSQMVKQKQPNEIGIYDMSGNVCEWTCTNCNPTAVSYMLEYYYVFYGGSFTSNVVGVEVTSYSWLYSIFTYYRSSIYYLGFRPIISF